MPPDGDLALAGRPHSEVRLLEARDERSRDLLGRFRAAPVLRSLPEARLRSLVRRARELDPDYRPGPALWWLEADPRSVARLAVDSLLGEEPRGPEGPREDESLDAILEPRLYRFLADRGLPSDSPPLAPDFLAAHRAELARDVVLPALALDRGRPRTLTVPPQASISANPLARLQGHLESGPVGVGATAAWHHPGGDGEDCRLATVEQGWALAHEDLVGVELELLWGRNAAFQAHGANTLGVVVARDNRQGGVGIAHGVDRVLLSSENNGSNRADTANAILATLPRLDSGDVLLVEAQAAHGGSLVPVEIDDTVYEVVRLATALGIVVVEPAGNGATWLDGVQSPTGAGRVFDRTVRDSGAILVGAATAGRPHAPLSFTNSGSRVDCFAWGEGVVTIGGDAGNSLPGAYSFDYGGTSSAAAIIAGAALCLQGLARRSPVGPLRPAELRSILTSPTAGTASLDPSADRIGVMPDLSSILTDERYIERLGIGRGT